MPSSDGASPSDRTRDSDADSAVRGGEQIDDEPSAAGPVAGASGRREVEVPPSLYRVVTVFSTLLSVLLVVFGFTLLGAATTVLNNPPGSLVVQVLSLAVAMETLLSAAAAVALVVGLAGLAAIAAGAVVYVYGSRFRAPGMEKPKDASDEESNDG